MDSRFLKIGHLQGEVVPIYIRFCNVVRNEDVRTEEGCNFVDHMHPD